MMHVSCPVNVNFAEGTTRAVSCFKVLFRYSLPKDCWNKKRIRQENVGA